MPSYALPDGHPTHFLAMNRLQAAQSLPHAALLSLFGLRSSDRYSGCIGELPNQVSERRIPASVLIEQVPRIDSSEKVSSATITANRLYRPVTGASMTNLGQSVYFFRILSVTSMFSVSSPKKSIFISIFSAFTPAVILTNGGVVLPSLSSSGLTSFSSLLLTAT